MLTIAILLRFMDSLMIFAEPFRVTGGDPALLSIELEQKGEELGWFEHGSTIIVLAPESFAFCDNVQEGKRIRAGEPLLRLRT